VKERDAWWYTFNTGDFTWEQFNGLHTMHEGAGSGVSNVMADVVAQAVAQILFVGGWNAPYCTDQCYCFVGVYQFWAKYSASARGLGSAYENDASDYRGYGRFADIELIQNQQGVIASTMARAQELGDEMLHPRTYVGD
jgi:hypothetical protein